MRIKLIGVLYRAKRVLYGNSNSSHIVPKDADGEDDSSGEEGAKEVNKGGFQYNVKIPRFKIKTGHENHLNLRRG